MRASAAVPPSRNTSHAASVETGLAVETEYDGVSTGVMLDRYPVATSGLVEMSPEPVLGVFPTGVPPLAPSTQLSAAAVSVPASSLLLHATSGTSRRAQARAV